MILPGSDTPRLTRYAPTRITRTSPRFKNRLISGLVKAIVPAAFCSLRLRFRFAVRLLLVERLDDADALCIFPDNACHLVSGDLLCRIQRNPAPRDKIHSQADKRQYGNKHQREHRLHGKRDEQSAEKEQRCPYAEPLKHIDHLVDVVGIGGQTTFQRRNGKSVELAGGKIGNPAEKIVADLLHSISGNARGNPIGIHVAEKRDRCTDKHCAAQHHDPLSLSQRHYIIDHICQKHRNEQLRERTDEFDGKAADHAPDIRFYVCEQVFYRYRLPMLRSPASKEILPEQSSTGSFLK